MKTVFEGLLGPLLIAIVGGGLTIYSDVQRLNEIASDRIKENQANEKEFKERIYILEKKVLLLENK